MTTEARKDKLAEMDFEEAFAPKPVKKTLAEQTKTRPTSSSKKNKKEPKSTQKEQKSAQKDHVIVEEREESETEQENIEMNQSRPREVSPQKQTKQKEQVCS